jgi:hypothetical protein
MNPPNETSDNPQEKPDLASQGQTLEPSEKEPEKPKRKLPVGKILVTGIVILITLLAFGLIAYMLMGQDKNLENQVPKTQSTSPSATSDVYENWKIYEGDGFSFRYPENWQSNNRAVYDPSTSYKSDKLRTNYTTSLSFINTPIYSHIPSTLEGFIGYAYGFKSEELKNISEDININNILAKSFCDINPKDLRDDTSGCFVVIPNGDNMFIFQTYTTSLTETVKLMENETYRKIIESIKFDSSIKPKANETTMAISPESGYTGDSITINISGIKDTNYGLHFKDSEDGSPATIINIEESGFDLEKNEYNGTYTIPSELIFYDNGKEWVDSPNSGEGEIILIHLYEPENPSTHDSFSRILSIPFFIK